MSSIDIKDIKMVVIFSCLLIRKKIGNSIRKQEKFMRGDIQKKKVTKKIQSELRNVEIVE